MKIYNIALFTFILILFYANATAKVKTQEKDTLSQVASDLDAILKKETPLDFSKRSLKETLTGHSPDARVIYKHSTNDGKSRTEAYQESFIKHAKDMYNKNYYTTKLSQDGSYIIQFLELSNEMNLCCENLYVCMRLFYNKIKACELIDDTVIQQLLNNMPKLLDRYFDHDYKLLEFDLMFIKKNIENMMLTRFTSELPSFMNNPDVFISDLATGISSLYEKQLELKNKDIKNAQKRERLRQIIFRFLDTGLNKTIWNPESYESIWDSFTRIAHGLQVMAHHEVINHSDDLDDLFWTHVHRFCFFLDLTGARLPLSFYEQVENDLNTGVVYFLEAPEQDEGIKSKKETLIEALAQAKTKAFAYENQGIIPTDMMV